MTDLSLAKEGWLFHPGEGQDEETMKLPSLCHEINKERVSQVDEGYFTKHFSFGAESMGSQCDILKDLLPSRDVNYSFSASEVTSLCNQSEVAVVVTTSLEQQVDTETVNREAALEKRVAELEKQLEAGVCAHSQETQEQYTKDLRETIQLCETLMRERTTVAAERDLIEQEFYALSEENQALMQEKEYLLRALEEKREVEEFRSLEQESTKQYEKELLSEIFSLKKAADKSATHIQNLEADLAAMSAELKRKDEWIVELQTLRNKDSAQEIRHLKRSLEDAETLSRETKKEWALVRTEMLALQEKDVDMTDGYKKMETELQGLREQLKVEKTRFKRMQEDLQKELHKAFQENVKLNSLLREKDLNDIEPKTIALLRQKVEQLEEKERALQARLVEMEQSEEKERALQARQADLEERERALQARLAELECSSKLPVRDDSSEKRTGDKDVEPGVMKGGMDSTQTSGIEGADGIQLVSEPISMSQVHAVTVDLQEEDGEKQHFISCKLESLNSGEELEKLQSCLASLRQERDQLLEKLEALQVEVAQFRKLLQKNGKMAALLQQCLDSEPQSKGEGEQLELQQQLHDSTSRTEGVRTESSHQQAKLEAALQELLTAMGQEAVALLEQRRSSSDHEEQPMSSLEEAKLQFKAMRKRVADLEKAEAEAENLVSTHKEATHLLQTELQNAYAQLEEKDNTISSLRQKMAEKQLDGGMGLQEMRNLEFLIDLERTTLTAKHQEELRKMVALLDDKEETIRTLIETLERVQKQADQSLMESTRGRTVLSPVTIVQDEEVKLPKSDHCDRHVTSQRGQATKSRRRATKLKENWSEASPHTTPTRRCCILPPEGQLFESPKSKFFDARNATVHLHRPQHFFDNSSLGTIPDLTTAREDNSELWLPSPKHDDNCKAQ